MHKEGYQQPLDECTECHGSDLKGGMYSENGVQVACASCYQCHSSVWERTGGGGGGNVFKFFKQNSK